jgi:hypothetical protein
MRKLEIFAWRNGRSAILAASAGGSTCGVNLHREGGLSITGLPASGGTTIAWGRLRSRTEEFDRSGPTDRRLISLGPVAVRVGRDF